MRYPTKETINPNVQKVYDEAFCRYLDEGFGPMEAADKADEYLLEWSQPMYLPDAPAAAWTFDD